MAFNKEKPGSGKFASGNKFKGRASAAGNSNNYTPRRSGPNQNAGDNNESRPARGEGTRPFREDRMAKFNSEGKKVYNRSERFTRSTDETGNRSGGDRPRSFDDKRASFKSGPKFTKGPSFKGASRSGEGNERQGERGSFNRERTDRTDRSERPERPERGDRPERSERYPRNNNDRPERPRYGDKRNNEEGYAARGERRPATGSRPAYPAKPYGAKPAGAKSYGDRRPDYNNEDKPRFNKFRSNDENSNSERPKRAANYDGERPESRNRFGGFNRNENRDEHRSAERPRGNSFRPAASGTERPFSRNRTENDRNAGKEYKKPFGARSEEIKEAPNYDLKRYQSRERRSDKTEDDGLVRLNRYIANAGVCSRREADNLIAAGEIKVNGQPITEMGYLVKPEDTVTYGKKRLNREKMVYVVLNKPKDFITTTEDPEGRKTVMDLVATASKERIFPVGRLDRNTTGLLLFTNDGELAQKLTHPSNNISKIYQVELDKPITREHFEMITNGLELEDGKAEVDDLALIGDKNNFLGIQIHIGKNRIVRRIFEHLGYEVVSLDRVQYAGLTKKDVPRGKWRFLTEKEVIRLKYFL
ncbi:pseudouridine synthase [Adhaeribacter aerolatus]|uniref:Pseudouridine synthase n=1 Tax=Adhaeribacter aerolatus TaxID=670289 RepID=A0A512AWY2_9BACT|nr:pseudouridine synthase [Adhaeribacter aerolatus]GEO04232.1 pseudouridine synthase [Adhaeribacter aerolatus]